MNNPFKRAAAIGLAAAVLHIIINTIAHYLAPNISTDGLFLAEMIFFVGMASYFGQQARK